MMVMSKDIQELAEMGLAQGTTITTLKVCVRELELSQHILWDCVTHIKDKIEVHLPIVNLTDSKDDETTNKFSGGPSEHSDNSDLYNNGRQPFLSVPIINIDEDPAENIELTPVHGFILAVLPGPSVIHQLIPIEEDFGEGVPPCLQGSQDARSDVEVKKEELEGKVTGTLEFWAGDYE
jgi:hypothetical protein